MIDVYIDGASAGDRGKSGAGIFINYKNGKVEHVSIPLGEMSNIEAEFAAFVHALSFCIERNILSVSFRTDCKLLEDAVERKHVKNSTLKPYLLDALEKIEQFDLFFIKWIPRKQNQQADQLAKRAIQMQC